MEIKGSRLFIKQSDKNLKRVREKFGENHIIEAVIGTSPNLSLLKNNQSTCWGDGENYHFKLTKKE